MRSVIKKILPLCLACFLIACCTLSSFSVSAANNNNNYHLLFEKALTGDGADNETVAAQLADEFDKDAEDFLNSLTALQADEKTTISQLLVYGESYGNLEVFEKKITSLRNSINDTSELSILDDISDALSSYRFYSTEVPDGELTKSEYNVFDPDIIKGFIDDNILTRNVDEELYHTLGNAYRMDTGLFIRTISDYDPEIIDYIAEAVAYDCNEYNEEIINPIEAESLTASESAILKIFKNKIEADKNTETNIFHLHNEDFSSIGESPKHLNSTYVPTIGTMTYTSSPLYVGTNESLKVNFTESAHSSVERTYYTKVYTVNDGVSSLKASKSITIPAGSTSVSATYTMSFSTVGEIYTIVKVYSSNGGSLLASRQGIYSDNVYGKWRIAISFSSNRNTFGTMTVYNASGVSQMSVNCLGKSAYGYDMYTKNGHTPTGTYTGYLYGPVSPSSSYGPYKVVAMTGVSGVIVTSGRSGIWIHGGTAASTDSATYPLRPTYGCVRISNSNQNTMVTKITALTSSSGYHDTTGNIIITQS